MKKILLDTSAYSQLLRGSEEVANALSHADLVYLSVFVLGELYASFKGGSKEAANRKLLERFHKQPTVQILPATKETAEVFGEIKNTLKRAGTPLPLNDVWIAAHAVETGSIVATFDSHFRQIPGLRLWEHMPR
ncbi:MAG TPA: type II toxin-antitoxin system VapC family toxin [Sedimentisphaerales bacterium]|nr:type II toxin-antitoxin system VapC family toxin [Sedimentisphaerales bacterium]